MVGPAGISASKFLGLIKAGGKPAYLFLGEEEFLKDALIGEIKQKAIATDTLPFNYHLFYCDEAPVREVVGALRMCPSMSPYRLVVLERSDAMGANLKGAILSYLRGNPSPTTILILLSEKSSTSGVLRELSPYGTKISFRRLYEGEHLNWVKKRASELGKAISREAAHEIIEYTGRSLRQTNSELVKLSIYIGQREEIDIRDVRELAGQTVAKSVFDLNEAICERNSPYSLTILSSLLKSGVKTAEIINLVSWQLRRIYLAKDMLRTGAQPEKIGRELKVHSYFLEKFMRQVGGFSTTALEECFSALLEADLKIKSTPMRQGLIAELLVIRLCLLRG